jgi:hypothetical protein
MGPHMVCQVAVDHIDEPAWIWTDPFLQSGSRLLSFYSCMWVTHTNGAIHKLTLLKLAIVKVHEQLPTKSCPLPKWMLNGMHAGRDIQMYRAETVTTTNGWECQVCLNWVQPAATTWSDANQQRVIESLEYKIHQVTSLKYKQFNEFIEHHGWQWLQDIGTKPTSPRSTFTKYLAKIKTAI